MTFRIALALALTITLAGCGGSSEEAATTTATPTTTTAPPTTTTTTTTTVPPQPATTTAAPTTTDAPTTSTAAPTTTAEPSTTTTTNVPPLPDGLLPTHGGDAVGVYLGVVEYDEVEGNPAHGFVDAITAAEAMGYFVGSGDLACDQGAQEALGLPADGYFWAASVLFATLDDAAAFVAAYPGEVIGIAEVKTFCLD